MRHLTIGLSLLAILFSTAEPSFAGKDGVPSRRVGGGTRWTQPKSKQFPSAHSKLSAMTFASRNNLPIALRLKAIYG
ncbi:hypothetical protein AB3R30_24925 [Leptolyngbyaceae cyanobacterium UHCC 1019]